MPAPFRILVMIGAGVVFLTTSTHAEKTRTIAIFSNPSGAEISWPVIDPQTKTKRKTLETTPYTNKFILERSNPLVIDVTREDYFPEVLAIPYEGLPGFGTVYPTNVNLTREQYRVPLEVRSSVTNATVEIDDGEKRTGSSQEIRFKRTRNGTELSEWSAVRVTVAAPNHQPASRTIQLADMPPEIRGELDGNRVPSRPWPISIDPREIRREVSLTIETDIPDVEVMVDSQKMGKTAAAGTGLARFTTNLVYLRGETNEFAPKAIRIEKVDFEISSGTNSDPQPFFQTNLSPSVPQAIIALKGFHPAPFVRTPVQMWALNGPEATIVVSNYYSATKPNAAAVTEFTQTRDSHGPIVGKIATIPDTPEGVVYSVPSFQPGTGPAGAMTGASLMLQEGAFRPASSIHRPRRGEGVPLDPVVVANVLYFSGIYNGCRCIMSKPFNSMAAAGAVSQIYHPFFADSQPAVAPGNPEKPMIAFTRRPAGNVADSGPVIMLFRAANGSFTQLEPGHSPAWDPEGNKLAFVNLDSSIATMTPSDGKPSRPISEDGDIASNPVWSPNGLYVIYSVYRQIGGRMQSDIVMVRGEGGEKKTLVDNGSFNQMPAVSGDGKRLFFFTNSRGLRSGEMTLRIDAKDLPPIAVEK